mmetsp:Transcript_113179/g.283297  ORF Transcript_113179/g.283297 Transcript_113179/m.283297 type:complete len:313 (+) Transcript_113179:562-1500(+)
MDGEAVLVWLEGMLTMEAPLRERSPFTATLSLPSTAATRIAIRCSNAEVLSFCSESADEWGASRKRHASGVLVTSSVSNRPCSPSSPIPASVCNLMVEVCVRVVIMPFSSVMLLESSMPLMIAILIVVLSKVVLASLVARLPAIVVLSEVVSMVVLAVLVAMAPAVVVAVLVVLCQVTLVVLVEVAFAVVVMVLVEMVSVVVLVVLVEVTSTVVVVLAVVVSEETATVEVVVETANDHPVIKVVVFSSESSSTTGVSTVVLIVVDSVLPKLVSAVLRFPNSGIVLVVVVTGNEPHLEGASSMTKPCHASARA